jgi:UDP-glucuronate decarboxylase
MYAPHGNNGNGSRGRYVVLIGLAVFALCTLWIIERQFLPPVAPPTCNAVVHNYPPGESGPRGDRSAPPYFVLPPMPKLAGGAKRILITGGAGFIGSHLTDRLLAEGNVVILLDNFFTGNKENYQHHLGNPHFHVLNYDVIDPIYLDVDQIYHLACPASPVHYQFDPIKTMKTNVIGTLNMLGVAKRTGARLLLASTSEVYGDPEVHPQVEEYRGNVNTTGIRSCYDEGKRAAETIAFDYHREHKVEIRVARIFNTYGPRMNIHDGRVVSNFITQALMGSQITVYGEGKQTRSFCYVSDLVDGLMRLMNGDYIGPVNLGNPNEMTVHELAVKVKGVINDDIKIVFKDLPSDDPRRRQPDITKARHYLGWEPKVTLDEGLRKSIDYFTKAVQKEMSKEV